LEVSIQTEALLEQMIVADPAILSDGWLIIGRQVRTTHGGFIDLLALNADGQLIIIELKRHQTPREVVAQAIDYASWAQELAPEKIAEIYQSYSKGGSLDDAFKRRFATALDEEQLDGSHQIVIVAASLDASTERIVRYLSDKDVAINVLFFQVFQDAGGQLLSRAWFIDPIETESKAIPPSRNAKGEWNGEFYVSFGHGQERDWSDAMRYGFISAGGGIWYSRTLTLLSEGDRIWVLVPEHGYVGVGRVLGPPIPGKEFFVDVDGTRRHIFEVSQARYHRHLVDDEEKSEYFVPVKWIETKPLSKAVSEVGLFGNQNSVCRPRTSKWNHTVERLMHFFPSVTDGAGD
jgi:hypothetical protein